MCVGAGGAIPRQGFSNMGEHRTPFDKGVQLLS